MKVVTVSHRNGIPLKAAEARAINLRNFVKVHENAAGYAVIRLDADPGSRDNPVSYTLNVNKAAVVAMIALDASISTLTVNVYNPDGTYVSTTFNEKYIMQLRDCRAEINGTVIAAVEILFSDGGFLPKKLFVNSTLAALVASNLAEFVTYGFAGVAESVSVINFALRTIAVTVPFGTDVSNLVATFTTSANITSIKVGTTAQTSATTGNDFGDPIVYTIVASDTITTRTWTVTVTIDAEE